jgi:DNA helicase-2/ATP-dependent DNA helicase PcrA
MTARRAFADLHLHSRHSRATSPDCDLAHLWLSARQKGLALLGTGDFTHPGWRAEIAAQLEPVGEGVFGLRPELAAALAGRVPRAAAAASAEPRFVLSAEIATIYKRGDRTRKVHHVLLAPGLEEVERLCARLERIGNLRADGRPILGLDSRDLLELTLSAGPGCCLIPAHVWTPWFSVLGSRSGFDSIEECYRDLAGEIFALETGLSSDPAMNWRVSGLDRYRLISSSDAHSPHKLGREAIWLEGVDDYPGLLGALRQGRGYLGTVEFFPEEGKYHLDGHRACGQRLSPRETRAAGGRCPACGAPVTVGVMHRVEELADRPAGVRPATAGEVLSLVPLEEVLAEVLGSGARSKTVAAAQALMLDRLGPELELLARTPLQAIERACPGPLAEGLGRMRRGEVLRQAGYDGEYGQIRLFGPHELSQADRKSQRALFEGGDRIEARTRNKETALFEGEGRDPAGQAAPAQSSPPAMSPPATRPDPTPSQGPGPWPGSLDALDPEQREAVLHAGGPLLVVAGPGSGKTRTLTHRLAELIARRGFAPEGCLVLTFTRKAADELRLRLAGLLPGSGERVQVFTFHALCLALLERHAALAERLLHLPPGFQVAEEEERVALMREQAGLSEARARRLLGRLRRFARAPRSAWPPRLDGQERDYRAWLRAAGRVDFDELVELALGLLEASPPTLAEERQRVQALLVDEYQDVDARQARLLSLLEPESGELCVVGDPDQSIYGFRGAFPGAFERFSAAHPGARRLLLTRNHRSTPAIADAARQVLAGGQDAIRMLATRLGPERIGLHAAASDRAEAEHVVASLEGLVGGHSFFSLDSGRGLSGPVAEGLAFSDVAVLYRLDALAEPIVEALERSGIPWRRRSHERLADALGGDGFDQRADFVRLMTLHAAKGLEFRVVFLVGCEDGVLPLSFGPVRAAPREEERRLLYVGMTRATERLCLSWAARRRVRGKLRDMRPSPFLDGIAEALTERGQTRPAPSPGRRPGRQLDLL